MTLSHYVVRLPIIGRLFYSRGESHWEAIKESLLAILFSSVPIWLPLTAGLIIPDLPAGEFLVKLTGEGELFLYASAFVGPLVYAISKERLAPSGNHTRPETGYIFPYATSFMVLSILICMLSVMAFALIRLSPLFGLHSHGSEVPVIWTSFLVYLLSVLCLYSASVYRNELENVPEALRADETAFLSQWNQRQ